MTVEDALIEKLKGLRTNRKQEVLDFVEFLEAKDAPKVPRPELYGSLADLDIQLKEEDISELRKEAWKNFPRENFFDNESNGELHR